jgi:VanZ family protein
LYDQSSPRPESGGLSLRTALPFGLFLFFLGLWTYEVLAENPVPESVMRLIPTGWRFWLAKGLHVAAYAVLTLLAAWLPIPRWVFWLVVAGLLLHGIGTEFGQTFTANRSGSLRDVVLDWVGVGAGLLALAVLNPRRPVAPRY